MKIHFYTALFFLFAGGNFSGTAIAQTQSYARTDCELILESEGNIPITAEINGRRFGKTGTTLRFGNIPAGRKDVVIYRVNAHRSDGGASARIIWEGRLVTKRGVQTIGTVNAGTGQVRFQNYRFDEMPYSNSQQRNANNDSLYQGKFDARPDLMGRDRVPNDNQSTAGNTTDIEARWNNLEKAVAGKITDTDKLKTLKDYLGGERISVANLRRSMGWLSFETSKLEWAKSKIADVADPENLVSVSADFTFSANQKAFEEAVAKVRR